MREQNVVDQVFAILRAPFKDEGTYLLRLGGRLLLLSGVQFLVHFVPDFRHYIWAEFSFFRAFCCKYLVYSVSDFQFSVHCFRRVRHHLDLRSRLWLSLFLQG